MAGSTLKQGTGKELRRLFAMLTSAIGETLGSLVGRELVIRPGEVEVLDSESLVGALQKTCAVARGALDKGFAGKTLYTVFEAPDAVAMAGMLMMTPDDVIQQRRAKGNIEGEDAEAFGELGNVLCSGMGNVLREALGNIDIRLQDHGVIKPGLDKDGMLPGGAIVALTFKLKVGDFPESTGYLITDFETAEAWNKGPLETGEAEVASAAAPAAKPVTPGARLDEEGLQDIPAAPIRGTLAAFVTSLEVFRVLRRSCRRVGLELRRHGKGEIPNPAAHKNEIVLLDAPPGEDRRFDWCRRIKEFGTGTKVVLLLHHPSRQRVTQAFLSRADAILGFPCEEPQLSQKLDSMLGEAPPPPPPAES
jgi:CheY-like chemotaxis protein